MKKMKMNLLLAMTVMMMIQAKKNKTYKKKSLRKNNTTPISKYLRLNKKEKIELISLKIYDFLINQIYLISPAFEFFGFINLFLFYF